MDSFSRRHGFGASAPEITIRQDAPENLRYAVASIAHEAGLEPHAQRAAVCRLLRVPEDRDNWSAFPNVDQEVRDHLQSCEWYEVYDIIEVFHARLVLVNAQEPWAQEAPRQEYYEQEMNRYFRKKGIGWQLRDGKIQTRGPEAFEQTMTAAREELGRAGKKTAQNEIHEALIDLSKRPDPDLTGALQHGLVALECVARDVTGDVKANFGKIVRKHKQLLPPPIDEAAGKLWGYASEEGRHLREGREPSREEVELAVHVAAALSIYLTRKVEGA